jgi:CRP/FNR family transcriptional regulator, cyclic AMP receptor protein
MALALQRERAFSDLFVAYLLRRNIRYHSALVDRLFDSSEKKLARVLLLLAHFGEAGTPEAVIPEVSQEALADMTCTTRASVNSFMNKFEESGFVAFTNNGLQIHSSLLNVVLND